jgi:hypothetical protein
MFLKLDSDISSEAVREWPDPVLREAIAATEAGFAGLHSLQSVLLAELVGRGRVPETMFGSMVSVREVTRRTTTAVALHDGSLPGAAAALASGTVSFEHVAALAEAKDDLPDGAAANLLADAAVLPPDKFARAVKKACVPAPAAEEPNTGRTKTTTKGRRLLNFDVNGGDGAIAMNALEKVMDQLFHAAHPERADHKVELPPYEQRLAEAFLEMCRRINAGDYLAPESGWTRPTVDIVVVVTYEKLFGDAAAVGICTTLDGQPLPVDVVRKLLVDARVYPVVMGGNGEVLDYGRCRRFFTETQKRAIAVRDGGTCQFADCDKPVRYSEAHHVKPWSEGGDTDVGNGAPACGGDHDKLTKDGYRLERRNGTTYTYAPDGRLIHTRTNRWRK